MDGATHGGELNLVECCARPSSLDGFDGLSEDGAEAFVVVLGGEGKRGAIGLWREGEGDDGGRNGEEEEGG